MRFATSVYLRVSMLVRHARGALNTCDSAGVRETDGVIEESSRDMLNYQCRFSAGQRERVTDDRRRLWHRLVLIPFN